MELNFSGKQKSTSNIRVDFLVSLYSSKEDTPLIYVMGPIVEKYGWKYSFDLIGTRMISGKVGR